MFDIGPTELLLIVGREQREAGNLSQVGVKGFGFGCQRFELPDHERSLPVQLVGHQPENCLQRGVNFFSWRRSCSRSH